MVATLSTGDSLTTAKATGLLQLSMHYLYTPSSLEVRFDLLVAQIKAACAYVVHQAT